MKRLALAVLAAAAAGLAACGNGAAPAAAPTAAHAGQPAASSPAAVTAASCGRQFRSWQEGNGKGLIAAFRAVSSAGESAGAQQLTAALRRARPAVARATRHPVPACADPRGYWTVLLMHVHAAVTGTASTPGVRAAMKGVPAIEHKLTVELRSAAR